MSDDFKKLYDINKTAEAIGIKPRALRYWVEKGEVVPLKIAGKFYFLPELINEVITNKLEEIENQKMEELDND